MSALSNQYPELLHYTDLAGVTGILQTQTLWATDARYTNDATELREFEKLLRTILIPRAKEFITGFIRDSPDNQEILGILGGYEKAVTGGVNEFVTSIYKAWLGNQSSSPSVHAYVASFSHPNSVLVANHGLLSQWRGYCGHGGYAVVFDTERLESLLRDEWAKWGYGPFIGDVFYTDESEKYLNEQAEYVERLETGLHDWLVHQENVKKFEYIFEPLIYCGCRYKHWGFSEEREVRIVAALANKDLLKNIDISGMDVRSIEKPIHLTPSGIPHISLFEGITSPHNPLPINRIIVGPGADIEARYDSINELVTAYDLKTKIFRSEIPYIPHR